MLQYQQFAKRFVVLRKSGILSPRFKSLAEIELPLNSLYHYFPSDPTDIGPEVNEIMFINYKNPIFINHLTSQTIKLGNPQKLPVMFVPMINKYRSTHRRFQWLRNFKTANANKMNLLVENYGMSQQALRYRPSIFAGYQRWYNQYYTLWENVARLQGETTRDQFIMLTLPPVLPSLTQLTMSGRKLSAGTEDIEGYDPELRAKEEAQWEQLKVEHPELDWDSPFVRLFSQWAISFSNTVKNAQKLPGFEYSESEGDGLYADADEEDETEWDEGLEDLGALESRITYTKPRLDNAVLRPFQAANSYWMLDFWIWLTGDRETSILSLIDHNKLDKINLIFEYMGNFSIVNLGRLNSWMEEIPMITRGGVEMRNPSGVLNTGKQMLLFFNKLFSMKTEGGFKPSEQIDEVTLPSSKEQPVGRPTVISIPEEEDEDVEVDEVTGEIKTETQNVYGVELPKSPFDDQPVTNPSDVETPEEEQPDLVPETFSQDEEETKSWNDEVDESLLEVPEIVLEKPDDVLDIGPSIPEDGIMAKAIEMAERGQISASEFRRAEMNASSYRRIKNPFGEGTLEDLVTIDQTVINTVPRKVGKDSAKILDKSMLSSSTTNIITAYTENVLQKDIAAMVLGIQNAGVAITNYDVKRIKDARSDYYSYSVQFQKVGGLTTTRPFRIPKIAKDGTYTVNGVKSFLCWQRMDKPIRKVNTSRVSLNSYYGKKLFVDRSTKSVHSFEKWLQKQIIASSTDTDGLVKNLTLGRHFNPNIKSPHTFAILSRRFRNFEIREHSFLFNTGELQTVFGEALFDELVEKGFMPCGSTVDSGDKPVFMVMDHHGMVYAYSNGDLEEIDTVEGLLGLDTRTAPVEIVELLLNGRYVPIVMVLCYYYGLTKLLKILDAQVRYVPRGERVQLGSQEVAVGFTDEYLVFSRSDRLASLVLGGLLPFSEELRGFNRIDLDNPNVFLSITTRKNITANWYKEMGLLKDLFIDPVTKEELVKMNAPTTFDALLLHAAKMLMTDEHRKETSILEQRVVGYERFAGVVYKELVDAERQSRNRGMSSKSGIDLNPDAVWMKILTDTSAIPMTEANPVQNTKLKETVTFGGTGGRNATTMVRRTREFLDDYTGVISEAGKDNANVGFVGFLTADAGFTDLRGNMEPTKTFDKTSQHASTVALLNYGCDRDSPQRTMFASIQWAQAMYAKGYKTPALRTGYEEIMGHRNDDIWSTASEQKGKVIEVTKSHIAVEYEDGTILTTELGMRVGNAAGTYFAHHLVTDLKVGDEVDEGDIISWNTNYYDRDIINPRQVSLKFGVMANVAFREDEYTFEDSSIVSKNIADGLDTWIVKPVPIIVKFDQEIRNLIGEGTEVEYDDILCTIENSLTSNLGVYSEEDYDGLKQLSSQNPIAKTHGKISRIEVLYNGEIDDMSESLAILTNLSDRKRARLSKQLRNDDATTGKVLEGLRVNGRNIEPNMAVIYVYITVPITTTTGDKVVYANQMKSTIGYIMDNDTVTLSGVPVDVIFSFKSELHRVVLSALIQGMMNSLLRAHTNIVFTIFKEAKGI